MVASTYDLRWSDRICVGFLIVLAACTIGVAGYEIVFWVHEFWWHPILPVAREYEEGCQSLDDGHPAVAVEAFDKAIEKDRGNVSAYSRRAQAYEQLRKPDKAIQDFTEVLAISPENFDACCGRASAYLATGFPEQALVDVNEAIRLVPNSHKALCLRARADLAAGRYDDAINDARRAIHLDAKSGDAFLALGKALVSSPNQRPDEAGKYLMEAFERYKAIEPSSPGLAQDYLDLSVSLGKAGVPQEAEKALSEAKQLDPKYVLQQREVSPKPTTEEEVVRAESLLGETRFDDALDEFTRILRMAPKNVEAWLGRGSAFLGKSDWDSAIGDFDRAIGLDPHSAHAYCLRAQAYLSEGDYFRARADATDAIRLKPDDTLAHFYRAAAYCKGDDFEPALANLDEAVRLQRKVDPRDLQFELRERDLYVEIYQNQARAYTDARRWEKAIDSLLAIDKLTLPIRTEDSKEAELRRQLVQAYQDMGSDRLEAQKWDEAIASFEKAIVASEKMVPSDKATVERLNSRLAQAYRERGFDRAKRGDFPEAARDLNAALDLDKGNAQTCRLCGLTCRLMAKNCHDRGLTDAERDNWNATLVYLNWAVWLDPTLEHEVQPALRDAQRNLGPRTYPRTGF